MKRQGAGPRCAAWSSSADAAGNTTTARFRFTLKAPRPKRRRSSGTVDSSLCLGAKDVVGAVAAALGVMGALIFGAQRVAYERFYDQFGVTPEDVGIDAAR